MYNRQEIHENSPEPVLIYVLELSGNWITVSLLLLHANLASKEQQAYKTSRQTWKSKGCLKINLESPLTTSICTFQKGQAQANVTL